eukprot:6468909-Alexandrium_andersonii.AAC.1
MGRGATQDFRPMIGCMRTQHLGVGTCPEACGTIMQVERRPQVYKIALSPLPRLGVKSIAPSPACPLPVRSACTLLVSSTSTNT